MELEKKIKNIPQQAGVYQYLDKKGRVLYIGKAKILKNRVKSYFKFTPYFQPSSNLTPRISKMISEVADINYILVDNEHDALILENSLIKQLQPKYNILLRDDKTYPYIQIDLNRAFSRFEITRKITYDSKIKYFGPFSIGARDILNSIYEIFPLVQKKSCLNGKKACLFYQIKRCKAPCEGKISAEDYSKIIKDAISVINDKKRLIELLKEKMYYYSEKLLFEEAKEVRDRIERISKTQLVSNLDLTSSKSYDIFSIAIEKNIACSMIIFVRDGKVISTSHSIFKSEFEFDKDNIYRRVLVDYYQKEVVPAFEILVYEPFKEIKIVEDFLLYKFKKKIKISIPIRGEKRKLTKLSLKNANEVIRLEKNKNYDILLKVKNLFSLERIPYVIEAYDNSHLQTQATVGAMIKWEDFSFIKKDYRHYNLEAKDEYAQMSELITKRCESFVKNPPPDLIIIDGGETLWKLAKKIINQYGIFVDVIAIAKEKKDSKTQRAKGRAKDTIICNIGTFNLQTDDKRLHFIQKMRDESHRFVINYHRKIKLKRDKEIQLLHKKGVGEATIKRLIQYFDTFENIENASMAELVSVVGIKIARNIKNNNL